MAPKSTKTTAKVFTRRTPKRRPGHNSKPRGMKTAITGKHPR